MVPLQGCLRIVLTSRRGETSEQWGKTISTSHPGPHRARHCRTDPCPGLLSSYPNHISVKVKMGPLTSSLRRRRYTFLSTAYISKFFLLLAMLVCELLYLAEAPAAKELIPRRDGGKGSTMIEKLPVPHGACGFETVGRVPMPRKTFSKALRLNAGSPWYYDR